MTADAYWARLRRDADQDIAAAVAGQPPNPYSFASSTPVPRPPSRPPRQAAFILDVADPYDAHWSSLIGQWEEEQQRAEDWSEHGASDWANRANL